MLAQAVCGIIHLQSFMLNNAPQAPGKAHCVNYRRVPMKN